MSSTGVNVLRWSALGLGVFYGIYHQSTIRASDKMAEAQAAYNHKQELIQKAKAEYLKKTNPQTSSGVVQDPMDPKFDLEAYLKTVAEAK